MKRLVYILLSLFLLIPLIGECQQLPHYNHYFRNPYLYNPSTAGINGLNLFAIHKSQWTSIPGAPKLNLLTLDGPIMNEKAGFGLLVSDDKRGITKRTDVNATFSYKVKFSDVSFLSFGFSGVYINTRLLFNEVIVSHSEDPMILGMNAQSGVFDAVTGLTLKLNKFQLGIAVPQILESKAEFSEVSFYQYKRHYLASAGYNFVVNSEKEISVTPLALAKLIPGAPVQYDVNLTADWKNTGWFGVSYRSSYGAGVNVGVRILEKLSVGYSFDINTGPVSNFVGLGHEFLLGYRFTTKPPTPKVKMKKEDRITEEIEQYKRSLKEQEEHVIKLIDQFYSKGPSGRIQNIDDIEEINMELEIFRAQTKEKINKKEKERDKKKK
ncbi:MAG: type IX secretion system membrane protein PorP/SprF [Bacteroidetes bacterium]|nr:type IX secretion system membrane protein PorP/SprF [Bacteroidota bacterium]HET6243594.1 type IX secretion system membrane protein PorP/SprF [Bacteroidia bacterium]